MKRLGALVALAMVLTLSVFTGASAHDTTEIRGTVDCQGNYSITVRGDIWGGIHLIVTLNGSTIYDEPQGGDDQSVRDFGPFTGSGAAPGDPITAKASDNDHTVTGSLELVGGPCGGEPSLYAATTASCVDTNGDGVRESARIRFNWDTDGSSQTLRLRARFGSVLRAPATVTVNGTGQRTFTRSIGRTATHVRGVITLGSLQRVVDRTITCQAVRAPARPTLTFLGPCGDPMHAVRFRNPTDQTLTGRFHWKHAVTKVWHTTKITVPAHSSRRTDWKHVRGNTLMTGKIGLLVKTQESADPGNYRACW